MRFTNSSTYRGRNTASGLNSLGNADTERGEFDNTVIENILSFSREFGKHNIFATALYSYERNNSGTNTVFASGFPHDFLSFYSTPQAKLIQPGYTYNDTKLISQMLRLELYIQQPVSDYGYWQERWLFRIWCPEVGSFSFRSNWLES